MITIAQTVKPATRASSKHLFTSKISIPQSLSSLTLYGTRHCEGVQHGGHTPVPSIRVYLALTGMLAILPTDKVIQMMPGYNASSIRSCGTHG